MSTPETIWTFWSFDLGLLGGLLGVALLHWQAVDRLKRRSSSRQRTGGGYSAVFISGLLIITLALQSPLEPLSEMLFSAHMVQHLLLILVAAPLLVWGAPPAVVGWFLPRPQWRQAVARWWHQRERLHWLTRPWVICLAYALTLWLWHLPALYEWALRLRWVHNLEHFMFLSTAVLFWWFLFHQTIRHYGLSLLLIFTTALHGVLLAALITFANRPWYGVHAASAAAWGLTPLQDQQLAGALMWVPSGIVYVLAAVVLLTKGFQQMEKRDQHRSGYVE